MVTVDIPTHAPVPHEDKQEKARIAHSYPGAAYILPADDDERTRLVLQHQFLKRSFGERNLLAPVKWSDEDKVLDACTGTGHWIVEVAEEVPENVQLQGIDIEPRLFPPVESRPKNLDLSIYSVLSLPPEWTNRFTVVHQRLLVVALRSAEWPVALKELYRVTKPGGWVQLCEFASWGGGPFMNQWWTKAVSTFSRIGLEFDCGQRLEPMLRAAGFVDIQADARTCPIGAWGGELSMMAQRNAVAVWKTMVPTMLNAARDLWGSEEEFNGFIDRVEFELEESESSYQWVVCLGRKPL
ncbi:S-adenosyl-L-methionine-dependent methyltransferase [Cyathus striatus]|nr:S-adenosyl-L-methionine-dependent methyltransferase [Cyathus striatus]